MAHSREGMRVSSIQRSVDLSALANEAIAIAEQYSVDAIRAQHILLRLQEHISSEETADSHTLLSSADLRDALDVLTGEQALELFETSDLDELSLDVSFVRDCQHGNPNLYTPMELEALVQYAIRYLMRKDNRSHFIQTGYPRREYRGSQWMGKSLILLYPTKCPRAMKSTSNAEHSSIYSYEWTQGKQGDDDGYCSALPMRWIPNEVIGALELLRPKVYEIRLGILRHLLEALHKNEGQELIRQCLRELSPLVEDDWHVLLNYETWNSRLPLTEQVSSLGYPYSCSGINALLTLPGSIQFEIEERCATGIRDTLGDAVQLDTIHGPLLTIHTYFEAFRKPGLVERINSAAALYDVLKYRFEKFSHTYIKPFASLVTKHVQIHPSMPQDVTIPYMHQEEFNQAIREVAERLRWNDEEVLMPNKKVLTKEKFRALDPNCLKIWYKGKEYTLGAGGNETDRSRIVKYMYEAAKTTTPRRKRRDIRADCNLGKKRPEDIFESSGLWGTLIKRVAQGIYELDR